MKRWSGPICLDDVSIEGNSGHTSEGRQEAEVPVAQPRLAFLARPLDFVVAVNVEEPFEVVDLYETEGWPAENAEFVVIAEAVRQHAIGAGIEPFD